MATDDASESSHRSGQVSPVVAEPERTSAEIDGCKAGQDHHDRPRRLCPLTCDKSAAREGGDNDGGDPTLLMRPTSSNVRAPNRISSIVGPLTRSVRTRRRTAVWTKPSRISTFSDRLRSPERVATNTPRTAGMAPDDLDAVQTKDEAIRATDMDAAVARVSAARARYLDE